MMKRNSEENALDAGGLELDDNLETRKEKMAQYIQEMRHFCQQIAQFPSEVKKVIEMHFSHAIISQLTYKLYADSIVFTKNIVFYSYLNTQYLIGENYDDIYDVWNSYRENVSKTIKTTQNLIDTNFFQDDNLEAPKWHGIEENVYWSNISFSKLKSEHELSLTNGNGLLQVLSHALVGIMEILDNLKAGYLFFEEKEFDSIYDANYLLYKRDYWSREGGNFRQNVGNNFLRHADNRIEELKNLLRQEKNDFVHSPVGVIWRDFFSDKKELYKRMKNDGINEEQWKYFFQHICRFEEYERWIEELRTPQPRRTGFRQYVIKPEKADLIVNRIAELVHAKSKPKAIMMPIRAAIDAGALTRPNWESFVEEFGVDKLRSKTSFSDYTNPDKTPYTTEDYQRLKDDFSRLINN